MKKTTTISFSTKVRYIWWPDIRDAFSILPKWVIAVMGIWLWIAIALEFCYGLLLRLLASVRSLVLNQHQ